MSDKAFNVFLRTTTIGCVVIFLGAFVWTIVFWNSPLLSINFAIPLLAGPYAAVVAVITYLRDKS